MASAGLPFMKTQVLPISQRVFSMDFPDMRPPPKATEGSLPLDCGTSSVNTKAGRDLIFTLLIEAFAVSSLAILGMGKGTLVPLIGMMAM